MKRLAALLAVGAVTPLAVPAQQTSSVMAAQQAESLRLAGRPWHAAEALLAAAARELHLDPGFVLAGAKAELHARRYDRARGLLAGQPWLAEYADGEGLAVLAEAEARLGLAAQAAVDYAAARTRAHGPRAALLAVRAPFVVSFSDQWAITNFDEMINLLRYFDRQEWVDSLRKALPEERGHVWRRFYKATDPVAMTPENEALDQYFRRVQTANERFRESGDPGWLTDRGEVFITLGEPDDVFDASSDVSRSGVRLIRWTFSGLRLTLFFQDQTGFGRFRLTPMSRAEYQRVLSRVRRAQ